MRPATKLTGKKYYEYILWYVDDFLYISHDTRKPMNNIQSTLKFKNDNVEEPRFYLGAKLSKRELNVKQVWSTLSAEYIKSSIKNLENQLKKKGNRLPAKAVTSMAQGYHLELDDTNELDQYKITTFQELIEIIRWAIEIGRLDIFLRYLIYQVIRRLPVKATLRRYIISSPF